MRRAETHSTIFEFGGPRVHTGRSIATQEGNHECPRRDREPSFPLNNKSPVAGYG